MIHTSPLQEITIPSLNFAEFALEKASNYGDRAAFIDAASDRTLTYGDLLQQVDRIAAAFGACGMGKDDVLAICLPNSPEFAVAVYAATRLGAAVTTVNPLYTAEEVARQLKDAGAKYLLTLAPFVDVYHEILRELDIADVFVVDEHARAKSWADLLAGSSDAPAVQFDPAEQIAILPYSSGTTGMPKGVMLTHRALVANATMVTNGPNAIENGEVFACVPPMFHIYGIMMYLGAAMHLGGTVICMPRFDFESYLKVIERYRASFAVVVPPVALGLAQHPAVDAHDLSSLRMIVSSAAPLAPSLAQAMETRIGAKVVQGFGMTELAGASHTQGPDDPAESVGVALPNIEWKVVDLDSGEDLAVGAHGEVCIRTPSVMKGYLNKPAETANVIDAEGWLHTGDIGYADEQGRCYLIDRLKELIKYKGYQVAPAELEAILLSHPNVADAGVVPMADAEAGEVPKAFVVPRGSIDAEVLKAFVAEQVAPYKKIREIEFVDELPKSPAGKILRRLLKERV